VTAGGQTPEAERDPTECEYEVMYVNGPRVHRGARRGDFALRVCDDYCMYTDSNGAWSIRTSPGDLIIDHLPSGRVLLSISGPHRALAELIIDCVAVELDGCKRRSDAVDRSQAIGMHDWLEALAKNPERGITFRQWKRRESGGVCET